MVSRNDVSSLAHHWPCLQAGLETADAISVGPWGGQSGAVWNDGPYSGIRQLILIHGAAGIDSIQVEYDVDGTSVWSAKHGGHGGSKTDKVKLNYPEEYLTWIHGHYGSLSDWSPVYVRSLTIGTNKRTYGPFGIEHGRYFSLPTNGIKIVGLHGRKGQYLDAIGAHLRPLEQIYTTQGINPQTQVETRTTQSAGYCSIIQGSLGNQYDVVCLALKKKEEHAPMQHKEFTPAHAQPLALAKQSPEFSSSSSGGESTSYANKTPQAMLPRGVPGKMDGPVTYGPWGGVGGSAFEDGMYNNKGIKQINFSRNFGLVSIRVLYVDHNGVEVWGDRQGGTGGFIRDKVLFDYPYEILTHISGYYGPAMIKGPTVIKSITFHTTKTKHGPFGEEQGTMFRSDLREGKIVGFHGRKGCLYIDAIGVHVLEGKVTPPLRPQTPAALTGAATTPATTASAAFAAVGCSPMMGFAGNRISVATPPKKPQPALTGADDHKLVLAKQRGAATEARWEEGPWGGDGGRRWDDGVYSGIRQIYITRDDAINSIQIQYDRDGQSVWCAKHGGNGGRTTHSIKLEYPNEVVTGVSGYFSSLCKGGKSKVIRSLTFYTTKGKCGPYGEEVGTFFTSVKTEGKMVVGFHGSSSGSYLDGMGVHMQHWLGNQKLQPKPIFKMFTS